MPVRIAIVGDFDPEMHTHAPLVSALQEARGAQAVEAEWMATTADVPECDGIVLAPGSPYRDIARVLDTIRQARERCIPFLGICGGFQHVLIEYARNVLGLADADSAEHGSASSNLILVPMPCRLDGRYTVRLEAGTRLAALYGHAGDTEETYFCGYQADAAYEARFEAAGLRINAHAADGAPRGCELADHPFFLATAFQPQMRSGHPVMAAFVQAATQQALHRTWTGIAAADYAAHMNNTGQAAANARLSAELLAPFDGGRLLVAGAGPGQMLDHGLQLGRFDVTFTDVNATFLAALRQKMPTAAVALDDLTATKLTETFSAVLVVLVLEHVDWRRALASLARLADHWLIVIQRNPPGMATAVTPGAAPPGTMSAFATQVKPHLIDEAALHAEAARHGYAVSNRREAAVKDGKAMIGLHFTRSSA